MAPSDGVELMNMVRTAASYDDGPIAFRYPRGATAGEELPSRGALLELGKGRILHQGGDIAILSLGAHLEECIKTAQLLAQHHIKTTIADARFAKPLDVDLIRQLVRHHRVLLTVEQGARGGFGSMVLHQLANDGLLDGRCQVRCVTLPDEFIDQDKPELMYRQAGMSAEHMAQMVVRTFLGNNDDGMTRARA